MKIYLAYATLTSVLLIIGCTDGIPHESPPSEATGTDTTETGETDRSMAGSNELSSETNDAEASVSEANFPDMVQSTHQQINEFRRSQGLAPLTFDPVLSEQARQHSAAMAEAGVLSHDGFDQRVSDIREELSVRSAAENVAANSGFDDPVQKAVEGWTNSEGHRQNILGNFDRTGIGIVESTGGEFYFTQIFTGS